MWYYRHALSGPDEVSVAALPRPPQLEDTRAPARGRSSRLISHHGGAHNSSSNNSPVETATSKRRQSSVLLHLSSGSGGQHQAHPDWAHEPVENSSNKINVISITNSTNNNHVMRLSDVLLMGDEDDQDTEVTEVTASLRTTTTSLGHLTTTTQPRTARPWPRPVYIPSPSPSTTSPSSQAVDMEVTSTLASSRAEVDHSSRSRHGDSARSTGPRLRSPHPELGARTGRLVSGSPCIRGWADTVLVLVLVLKVIS